MSNKFQFLIKNKIRIVVDEYYIDYYLIHVCGFLFDIIVGFLFLWPRARPLAFAACTFFNLANSQMFNIGMFPWSMLVVMPIFCAPNWPLRVLAKSKQKKKPVSKTTTTSSLGCRQWTTLTLLAMYMLAQLVLPFAYLWLPGLNTWTKGLYGYNWDMMLHNWQHVHAGVRLVEQSKSKNGVINRQVFYLDPEEFTMSNRWYHHADMVMQFAQCLRRQLHSNKTYSLYLDVWSSLNGRFVQRIYNPRQDLFQVRWSPWYDNSRWVLPLISHQRRWRNRYGPIYRHLEPEARNGSMSVYIADFKGEFRWCRLQHNLLTILAGMSLQLNSAPIFVANESSAVVVIDGWLQVRYPPKKEYMLSAGDTLALPSDGRTITLAPIRNATTSYALLYPQFANTTQTTTATWGQCRARRTAHKGSLTEPWITR